MTTSINVHFIGMITSQEIENSDFSRVTDVIQQVIDTYKETRQLGLIAFGISGYENDNRALFDIPEVRKWSKAMYQAAPYALDLLHPSTLKWLLPCVADIEVVNRTGNTTGWRFREDTREAFITQSVNIRMKLCNHLAASQHEFDELADAAFERFKSAILEPDAVEGQSPYRGGDFVDVYPHSLVVYTDLPGSFFSNEEGQYWLIANRNIAVGTFLGMQSRDEIDALMAKLDGKGVNTTVITDCSVSEIIAGSVEKRATQLRSASDKLARDTTAENRQERVVPIVCTDAFKKTSCVRWCWFFE